MDKLVTVTCSEDVQLMILQAESIQRFVDPCEHLIIIEDDKFTIHHWKKILSKFYTNHTLTIKKYDHVYTKGCNGWQKQQVFKLAAAFECLEKYLVLDSKDFFIRKTNISEWDTYQGSNDLIVPHESFPFPQATTSNQYAKYFGRPPLDIIQNNITPHVINLKYIDKKILNKQLCDFVNMPAVVMSEFIFYNYMAYDEVFAKHDFEVNRLWRSNTHQTTIQVEDARINENVKVFSLHRYAWNVFTDDQKKYVNSWLLLLGLKNYLK